MTPPGGSGRDRESTRETTRPGAPSVLDRAVACAEELEARALRQERVLEVLDLRAARAARKLASQLRAVVVMWRESEDATSRAAATAEVQRLVDAAELTLLVGEAPASSAERPAPPGSKVPRSDVVAKERDADGAAPASDASSWQEVLGTPRRRRLPS